MKIKSLLLSLLIWLAGACCASDEIPGTYRLKAETSCDTVIRGTACAIAPHRLITAAHVIQGADEILIDHEIGWLRCKVVKVDSETDIAVLECKSVELKFIPLGAKPKVDEPIAIESPMKAEIVELPAPVPAAEFSEAKKPVDDEKPPTPKLAAIPHDSEVEVAGTRKVDASGFVLVEFNAEWCGPCQRNAANIEALEDNKGPYRSVYAINIDANKELAEQRNVHSIPCSIVYHNGKEVCRHFGVHTRDEMVAWATDPKSAR